MAIGLWATGRPLATYWPSGEGPLATDWPPTPTGHPLRGGPHHSLATFGHWLHHTGSGATPPAPLGRRGLWPKREPHTTGGGASLWPTGYNPLATPIGEAPLHGQRGPHPRLATYRPIGAPLATASPTGQRRGRPPLGEPHPPLATHWPPLSHTLRDGAATWPKGSRPLPLPGLREPHHARPPTGQTGRPTLATLPPDRLPTGEANLGHWPHTTGCLSGQKGRRAFAYWPPTPPPPPLAREGAGHP